MKAVILAAGEGARLTPLTNSRPKPMLPVANRPLLEYVIQAVRDAGIRDIVLVVGYKRERIQSYFGDGNDWGVNIEYAVQDKQLGTGHAVEQAAKYVSEDFVALNGDRILESEIIEQVASERRESGQSTMAVTKVNEPGLYGVVERDASGYVSSISEKPATNRIASDLINAGVYGFGPEIFDAINDTTTHGELELTSILTQNLADHPVKTVPYDGRWLDVSRPWDLVTVNGEILDEESDGSVEKSEIEDSAVVAENTHIGDNSRIYPNASILRGTAIGDNVTIGSNVSISNSIIMDDVRIQAGSVIQDAVIGENATLGPNVTLPGGKTNVILEGSEFRDVKFGGIVGDNASLGACTTVMAGTFVGNSTEVEDSSVLNGRIEPNSRIRRG